MAVLTNPGNWGVLAATVLVIAAVISLHYEALGYCLGFLPKASHKRRRRVVALICIILATHAAEIWLFGLAYWLLLKWPVFGTIEGEASIEVLIDYVYYSGMAYTTVGFGDLVPSGPIRLMTGMEALTGLVMITWSASFTFLEMQRDWTSRQS